MSKHIEYTLKFTEFTRLLHRKDADRMDEAERKGVIVIETIDGDNRAVVIDGIRTEIVPFTDWVFKPIGGKIHTYHHNAESFVGMFEKDMDDPNRFWSETYFGALLEIKERLKKEVAA